MIFNRTPIEGAFCIELEKRGDSRGFFARQFCFKEFQEVGIDFRLAQSNTSFSADKGTLRGMHYQLAPSQETKLVRCIHGSIWDCVLDLRQDSSSFGKWFGTELSAENRTMIAVPKGCAHGFLSLTEDSEITYLVDASYDPERERGVRWNDPKFGIEWPLDPKVISERDQNHPDFSVEYHLGLEPS